MVSRYLTNLGQELNDFLAATSIHGLAYIQQSQARTTRIIWTVLVAGALTTATVFLVQTVGDWDTKYITTTIQTESLENFPFPAVTFHPGDFSSQDGFLRIFLNQFEMTRYNRSSPLYDNDEFRKQFKSFLNNFKGGHSLFHWVADYLTRQKRFIREKRGLFREDICSLVSLISTGKTNLKNVRSDLINVFNLNMFKFEGFRDVIGRDIK